MNIHEIDWRYSSIKQIFIAVSAALDEIAANLMPVDPDEAMEQMESFLGIAFVAAQTYIAGTVSDAKRLARTAKPTSKSLQESFSDVISGTITKIQVCNEIANYFKHEWPHWTPKPKRIEESRRVLYAVGVSETATYPCQDTAKLLWGFSSNDLEPLLSMLAEWRTKVIAASR